MSGIYTSRMTLYLLNFEKKGVHSKANSAILEKKKSHSNCWIKIVRILGIANIQHLAFDSLEAAYRQHQQNYIFSFRFGKINFEITKHALRRAWIKRIIEGGDASWKTILN